MNLLIITIILLFIAGTIMIISTILKVGAIAGFLSSATTAVLAFGLQVLLYSDIQDPHNVAIAILLVLIVISITLFIVHLDIYYGNKIQKEIDSIF